MATNKERIEALEAGLSGVQEGMHKIEMGVAEKLTHLELSIHKLSDALLPSHASSSHNNRDCDVPVRSHRDESDKGRRPFSSKLAKLEFPRFAREDPTKWFTRVAQFFEYQDTPDDLKVSLAFYHLQGEANQWWQWLRRSYQEENKMITWEIFSGEMWARFGPTEGEDFDEALSHITQTGTLKDYQREFERLGNCVQGWSQKALIGTFMGGLKPEIAEGIRMFRPKTLKDAISLARMRDEQLLRQHRSPRPITTTALATRVLPTPTPAFRTSSSYPSVPQRNSQPPIKRLSWEEMQRRRAQGLCFNCNDKFTTGHKCRGAQLLLLEGCAPMEEVHCAELLDESASDINTMNLVESEPEISLHALTGWATSRTMRVTATVGVQEFSVLIDSGSTHNFISDKVAQMLRLPVIPTRPFIVRVTNGDRLQCHGRFEGVQVILQAMELALSVEKLVNEKLLNLHAVAIEHNDPQLADFVESEFLSEQVETIKKISEYDAQLRRVGKGHGVWHFDQKLLHEEAEAA